MLFLRIYHLLFFGSDSLLKIEIHLDLFDSSSTIHEIYFENFVLEGDAKKSAQSQKFADSKQSTILIHLS